MMEWFDFTIDVSGVSARDWERWCNIAKPPAWLDSRGATDGEELVRVRGTTRESAAARLTKYLKRGMVIS